MRTRVTVQVPATTSNCGPGFDTLGIALTLYNFVEIELNDATGVRSRADLPERTQEMVRQAAAAFARETGISAPTFNFDIWGEVPPARGLGSSATVRCGTVAALNELYGEPLKTEDMIRICSRLDGAPDGVAAAFKGGFCISRIDPVQQTYKGSTRFEVAEDLALVVVSPETEVLTEIQRRALPPELPFADAARTLNSLAHVVAVFATRDYARLEDNLCDFLHQPYRERLCPFTSECIDAGVTAGAYAGWLSGSGSSVLCVAPARLALETGKAMISVFENNGVKARLFKLRADNSGLSIR